jgi:predicted ATP-grasp superfamily ATP-dependent carboligase
VSESSHFTPASTETPVLVLGGKENSLAIARHLGARGIAVRVSGPANCWGMNSRYCRERFPIPFGSGAAAFWKELLLGAGSTRLHGHILFPCSDEALEFIAGHRGELAQHYLLAGCPPALTRALLDKMRTLELAREAGVPTPRFWKIDAHGDLVGLKDEVRFPVLVKPIHSHKFVRVFGRKLFIVEEGFSELSAKIALALEHGLGVMVVEMIPGPDSRLSSYNTFITETGESLFQFTKRIIRRYPVNSGNGCYHVTSIEPETAKLGQKLFANLGVRGFANVEFKQDPRDGLLKIIEINARFTAAHELIVQSGAPVDLIAYCHITGQPAPQFTTYKQDLRLWYPFRDFLGFMQLMKRGELGFKGWVGSIIGHPIVFPLFRLDDLKPSLFAGLANFERLIRGRG